MLLVICSGITVVRPQGNMCNGDGTGANYIQGKCLNYFLDTNSALSSYKKKVLFSLDGF